MELIELAKPELINLKVEVSSREEIINLLADQLDAAGKIADKAGYLKAVEEREEEGPTALGENLAVPHGKTDAVKEAGFAMATLKNDIKWKGLEGDEDVSIVFLLAIPDSEAGTTHIKLLTDLTCLLVDDDVREAMIAATDKQQVLDLLAEA